jgi:hypothetical protein
VGLIARYIHAFLAATGWTFGEIGVHDLSAGSAAGFRGYLEQSAPEPGTGSGPAIAASTSPHLAFFHELRRYG